MGILVGTMKSHNVKLVMNHKPTMGIERQKSRELFFQGKTRSYCSSYIKGTR